jgi:amino acid transporter
VAQPDASELRRHFGVLSATALNVSLIVGAGVFVTVPLLLTKLPGPYAVLGWLAAGLLILADGLVWAELGAALPGSGGSYHYLLECYGRDRWGRLFAFLFIWQFLLSGPLELASGLIAMDTFARSISPDFTAWNDAHTLRRVLWEGQNVALTISPARAGCVAVGALLLALLHRNVVFLSRLTLLFSAGVLGLVGWLLLEGALRFDPARAFDAAGVSLGPEGLARNLGPAMTLALYSYFGYYNICYLGDEVRDPGRTIPRAVLLSAALVIVLFSALHLAFLGTVSWRDVPPKPEELESYNLPAEFMRRAYEAEWPARLVALLLVGSCFASVFAGTLGYSRIPYGAARRGHFFAAVGRVHPTQRVPHVSLRLVGGVTLVASFFDLQSVIDALVTTRVIEQFLAQAFGVMLLRRLRPDLPRPFRVWLYPLPCLLALAGWLYVYCTAGRPFILLGLATLAAGLAAFLLWSRHTGGWPFRAAPP